MVTCSIFLPGESHGERSLLGYSPWGHKRVRHDLVTKQPQNWRREVLKFHMWINLSKGVPLSVKHENHFITFISQSWEYTEKNVSRVHCPPHPWVGLRLETAGPQAGQRELVSSWCFMAEIKAGAERSCNLLEWEDDDHSLHPGGQGDLPDCTCAERLLRGQKWRHLCLIMLSKWVE